ncbi:MAG: polysaccharide biosynthesis tyrosine autokinase [Calditrichaeota bacterium]|nr:polysaccharide biosynthesis tyrosine autokinase [Calditrichota bacterium]
MEKSPLQIPQFDYEHYLKLLWKKKFIIVGISILVFILWIGFVYKFMRPSLPELSATVTLVFDDARQLSAVSENVGLGGESRLGLMRSRSFLERIVEKENLRLRIDNKYRNQIFDSVQVDSMAKIGHYEFIVEKNRFKILYTFLPEKIERENIGEGSFVGNEKIRLTGIFLKFRDGYLKKPYSFNFTILRTRTAIDQILANLSFKSMDRRGTLFGISLTGKDHPLITDVVNTIADEFVKQNVEFKKRRTTEVINVLEKQLASANQELQKAQNDLKRFQQNYPWVGLRADVVSSINDVSKLESSVDENEQTLANLTNLQERARNNINEGQELLLNEMLSYLAKYQVTTVAAMHNELSQLMAEKKQLADNYSDQHPLVVINNEKINRLSSKIYSEVSDLIAELEIEVQEDQASRDKIVNRLRSLPAKAQEMAELQRKEEVASRIYSSILVRYNEAKIADAVEVGDIYVLDYAVVPFASGSMMDFIKKFVLGMFLALGIGVGTPIALDFLDKSVKSSKDIKNKLNLPVFATLPVIGNGKEIPDDFDADRKLDSRLVTSDYAPNIASESFRTLRTKLILNNEKQKTSVLIASMNPGEGKSLTSSNLAITFAQQKLPTILVDSDLRRGVIHHSFACEKKPGLSDFLIGTKPVSIENLSDVIQNTHVPNLFLISAGTQVPNPSELLAGERMKKLINILKNNFSILIVDTPPIEFIPDAVVLSTLMDQIVLVTKYGKTNLDKLSAKMQEFSIIKQKLSGIIINASPEIVEKKYYGYSYYQY